MTAQQLDLLDWLAVHAPCPAPSIAPEPVLLHRIDSARNMARFYSLSLSRDLFGAWCVIRRYGRIGARRGQVRLEAYDSENAARRALERLRRMKERRGYSQQAIPARKLDYKASLIDRDDIPPSQR